MRMSCEEWDEWTRGSAIRRPGYAGLRRNVAVALGNWGAEEAVPALSSGLADPDPLVRSHSPWALGQVDSESVRATLSQALVQERDASVHAEMEAALSRQVVDAQFRRAYPCQN
jgi:epoxyqueuosine reductase